MCTFFNLFAWNRTQGPLNNRLVYKPSDQLGVTNGFTPLYVNTDTTAYIYLQRYQEFS
jgi:hypothetical protein